MITKRLVFSGKGQVDQIECEIGETGSKDVLIETMYSTVSPGTELAYLNNLINTPGKYPYFPGYSGCGRIIEKGQEVENFQIGDTVVYRGMHSFHQIVDTNTLKPTKLPADVSAMDASAYRLASIALQAIRKADIQIGDQAAVLGLGPIGNLAAQIAGVAGGIVTGIDYLDWRCGLANGCGVDQVEINPECADFREKFDVVIEATGSPAAIITALKMTAPFGRVVLLGSTRGITDGINFYADVHRKGITIVGAHESYRSKEDNFGCMKTHYKDQETIVKLLSLKRIRTDLLISEVATSDQAQSVYERLLDSAQKLMLVNFKWTI